MSMDKQFENVIETETETETETVTSEAVVNTDASGSDTNNRRAFMTGALAATAGVVAASALGSRKAEAKPMAASMSMAAGSANFSFTYSTTEWGIQDVSSSNWYVHGSQGAETSLYYNGSEKLKTTSGGIEVIDDLSIIGDVTSDFRVSGQIVTAGGAAITKKQTTNGQTTVLALKAETTGDQGGNLTCDLDFQTWDSNTRLSTPNARISLTPDAASNSQALEAGGSLVFYTAIEAYTANTLTEGLRIDNLQNVSIPNGNLSVTGNVYATGSFSGDFISGSADKAGSYKCYDAAGGTAYNCTWKGNGLRRFDFVSSGSSAAFNTNFTNPGSGTYNVQVEGVVTAADFTATSDRSLKNNFQIIENPLERLLNLKGYIHGWKAGGPDSFGFIHDEIEASEPLLAIRNDEGLGSVNYQKVVPLIVEAAREMKAEKDKEIAELKTRLEKLEKLLS